MSGRIVEGKKIAQERVLAMRAFVDKKKIAPKLVALTIAPNVATEQFLKIKHRIAGEAGILMDVVRLAENVSEEMLQKSVSHALAHSDGVVIQLPFPQRFAIENILSALPLDLDPDCIGTLAGEAIRSNDHIILPPVVSAIQAVCQVYEVSLKGKRVVVVGQGRLVGAPSAIWAEHEGADVVRLTRGAGELREATQEADIIILGAGSPGLLTPDMIIEGVAIFDAGTSEEGGKVVGDADPRCAEKASLITPVPGGIGPIAVAELFGNLLRLKFDYPVDFYGGNDVLPSRIDA